MSANRRAILLVTFAALVCLGWSATSEAQIVYRHGPRRVIVGGFYYADPFWFDPWYGYGYQYPLPYPYPYPPYRYYGGVRDASVRLDVKPREAEVYVDGYYAGIVDDFDGVFQRLHVPPGNHEITLYLEGYRTVTQKVLLTPDNTFKISYRMERLAPGEPAEPRPEPVNPPPPPAGAERPYPPPGRGPARRPPSRQPPPMPPGPPENPNAPEASEYGSIAVRVQPADAEILIDGEGWHAPEGQDRLVVQLPEGRHTVEIRKSGYRTFVTDVQVRRSETTPLNVSLRAQDQP